MATGIPLLSDPNYSQIVTIFDGYKDYTVKLNIKWITRTAQWKMSVSTLQGKILTSPTEIRPLTGITAACPYEEIGKGTFICYNNYGDEKVRFEAWDENTASLYYMTEAEYDEFIQSLI